MKKSFLIVFTIICVLFATYPTSSQWTRTNGPYGANVTCLAKQGNIMFAGTDNSKIFKSTDNGNHWEISFNISSGWSINDIKIFGNFVVAATRLSVFQSADLGTNWVIAPGAISKLKYFMAKKIGKCGNKIFAFGYSNNIYSTDSTFNTWKASDSLTPYQFSSFAVNDNFLYATAGSIGVFKSSDYGNNWTLMKKGSIDDFYYNLAVDTETIYA